MEYQRFGNTMFVRIDRGEEILEEMKKAAEAEHVKLATVSALGALSSMAVGVYDVEKKQYFGNEFSGALEIVSLTGTITTMNGGYYSHIHLAAADDKGNVFGGHMNKGIVSATCEMVITVIDGTVEREKDDVTGLNLFKFL
jgi:uncharacterized protein